MNLDQGSGQNRRRKRASAYPRRGRSRRGKACVVALAVVSWPIAVQADEAKPTLAGTWSASSMTEAWSTSEWGEDCGNKPSSSGGAPAGTVTVADLGSELSFSGAGRSFSTAECWEPMPGLKRSSHSGGKRGWTSTCTSAPGDPRKATVTTRMSATDDTIVFNEVGVFEGHIKNSTCKASVSRSRSYKLIQRAGETPAPSATAPSPPPAPSAAKTSDPVPPYGEDICDPAALPARFEVRPTRKLLRPGDSFDLDVRVFDSSGCRLSQPPEITLDEASPLAPFVKVEKLTLTVANDAVEGAADVTVNVRGKKAKVVIEVTPADSYEALLAARGLNARGEDGQVLVTEIEALVGSKEQDAEDTARARRITFLAIVGGSAALLLIVALALARRGKRAARAEERVTFVPEPSNVSFFEQETATAMECPACGELAAPGTGFCPADGTALVPSKRPAPPLAAAAEPPAPKKKKEPDKICPTCGDRFAADAGFCGKDGTQLVPIN